MPRNPVIFARAKPDLYERANRIKKSHYGDNMTALVIDAVTKRCDEIEGTEQRRIQEAAIRLIEDQMGIRLAVAS